MPPHEPEMLNVQAGKRRRLSRGSNEHHDDRKGAEKKEEPTDGGGDLFGAEGREWAA